MRALFISPHADDAELWAGGTIAKHPEWQMRHIVLTCNPDRVDESRNAGRVLGLEPEVYDFQDTRLFESAAEIRGGLEVIRKHFNPTLVFCPSANDRHQDHRTVYEEVLKVFRSCSILAYDIPYNQISSAQTAFVHLSHAAVEKKIAACKCYQSQKHRPYMREDAIYSLARLRGAQCGVEYAEAFEVIRWVL